MLEELRAQQSQHDDFAMHMVSGTPFGRPVIGTEASLRGMTPAALESYYREHYQPHRMTLVVLAELDDEQWQHVLKLVGGVFSAEHGMSSVPPGHVRVPDPSRSLLQFAMPPGPLVACYTKDDTGGCVISVSVRRACVPCRAAPNLSVLHRNSFTSDDWTDLPTPRSCRGTERSRRWVAGVSARHAL